MDFPKETQELATRIASEIRKRSGNTPLELAKGTYNYLNDRFGYGFNESTVHGFLLRWPHEIERQWECIEAATYTYVITEALGLEPRLLSVKEWRNLTTGHETIDVHVDGQRVLIDPLNDMFGKVSYTKRGIEVEDNPLTDTCILECSSVQEISRERLIARTEYYRSDEGIINLMRAGQLCRVSDFCSVFIRYDPKTKVLEYQFRTHPPFLEPTYLVERYRFSSQGVTHMSVEQGIYQYANWATLEGMEPFWRKTVTDLRGEVKETEEKFAAGKSGWTMLLRWLLYYQLLQRKYADYEGFRTDPRFLFDDREMLLELIYKKLERMQKNGITPENKGDYNGLRKEYFRTVYVEQTNAQMQHILDEATLKLHIERLAKEQEVDPYVTYRRMLAKIGVDWKSALEVIPWDPFETPKEQILPYEIIDTILLRLVNRGLIH